MAVDRSGFVSTYGPLAQDIADRTGLHPALVLGQLAHETGWGQKVSGNNVFGISPGGKLAAYPSVPEAGQAYVDLINRRYADAANKSGISSQAEALSAGGYGPDRSYGQKIAAAANSVQAAGYKPAVEPSDDESVAAGRAAYEQITGTPAPPMPQAPTTQDNIDVSSDPETDRAKEFFKAVTGSDPDELIKQAPPEGEQRKSAVGTIPQAVGQIAGNVAQQTPGAVANFGAGLVHGSANAISPSVNWLSRLPGVADIDRAVPMLGRLDQKYSPSPEAEAQYQKDYGNSTAASVGNALGEIGTTTLATAPLGIVGGSIARAAGPIIGAGTRIATNAFQGGAAAGLTGGDVGQGALAGGAVSAAGTAFKGANKLLQPGGYVNNFLSSKMGDAAAGAITSYLASHLVGAEAGLAGFAAGPVMAHIVKTFGAKAGQYASQAIDTLNRTGILPSAVGIKAGAIKSPQPAE